MILFEVIETFDKTFLRLAKKSQRTASNLDLKIYNFNIVGSVESNGQSIQEKVQWIIFV